MIAATVRDSALAARLADKAARLAAAFAETRRDGAWRWRQPALLWPLFGSDR